MLRFLAHSLTLWFVLSGWVYGEPMQVGNPLPQLAIADRGELLLENGERVFRPWNSGSGLGQVQVVQYLAATLSASKINEPFTDALSAAQLPPEQHRVTTILNLDEALWGSSGFVLRELTKNKELHPQAIIVADNAGTGLKTWQLQAESSAIAIVSAEGEVLYFKQGAMSPLEIETAIQLIRHQLELSTTEN